MNNSVKFTDGNLQGSIGALVAEFAKYGELPTWVSGYLDKGEVDVTKVTDNPLDVQRRMWRYLDKRGASLKDSFDPARLNAGEFDEILYSAYDNALRYGDGRTSDPLSALSSTDAPDGFQGWDFTVDTFETIEEQGVLPDSIRAAGAIDYIFQIGERMRIFELCEALVLDWATGRVDVAEGTAAARLYRYWKLIDERSAPDERAMLYRRVLNKGGAATLDGAVVNDQFTNVWGKLMGEIADYIDKSERVETGRSDSTPVSPKAIYQALRELQYNLSEYCTGMAFMQTREMYAQLMEAFAVLRDPDVIASFGGVRRRNMWTVITELGKRTLNIALPVAPLVRTAVDGNRIFQIAAEFDEATFSPDALVELVEMGESYIINSSLIGEQDAMLAAEEEDDFADFDDGFEDDFDDF